MLRYFLFAVCCSRLRGGPDRAALRPSTSTDPSPISNWYARGSRRGHASGRPGPRYGAVDLLRSYRRHAVDAAGMVHPVADGEATITASAEGRTARVTVRVQNVHTPFAWSFRNDVLPVMSKVGCNSGACHGAAAGKNGFKLTLRGYDPEEDYNTLTRQSDGRRILAFRARAKPDVAEAHLR